MPFTGWNMPRLSAQNNFAVVPTNEAGADPDTHYNRGGVT